MQEPFHELQGVRMVRWELVPHEVVGNGTGIGHVRPRFSGRDAECVHLDLEVVVVFFLQGGPRKSNLLGSCMRGVDTFPSNPVKELIHPTVV